MIQEIIVFGQAFRSDAITLANDSKGKAVVLHINLPSYSRIVRTVEEKKKRPVPNVEHGFFPAPDNVCYLVVDKALISMLEDSLIEPATGV